MKRLTISRIAAAGLRKDKRAYLSLAAGIFLSIFLVTGLFLSVQGFSLAQEEKINRMTGYQDCFILDSRYGAGEVLDCGYFDRIGAVSVSARIGDSEKYLGWYDAEAGDMLRRRLIEGRMPEKQGEIAVEESMLAFFELDKSVGDELELDLTPVDGKEETRTYTITGILEDQTTALDVTGKVFTTAIQQFPAAVVYGEENFSTGRTAVHYLLTLKAGASVEEVLAHWMYERADLLFYILADGSLTCDSYEVSEFEELFTNIFVFYLIVIGAALLIACCVGIAQAMESRLTKKVDQIGMLRAVGATRRQIRKIFGREAWLLAMLLMPAGVAAGCLVVFVIACLAPEEMIFYPNPMLLIPVAILSGLCILLAASLPLRRASRIMPMSVIRDTELLRKSKSIRARKQFSVPQLIAARQMRLRGARQIGAAVLVMLMLICIAGAAGFSMYSMDSYYEEKPDFEVFFQPFGIADFEDTMPHRALTDQDMAQIRSLPHVERAETARWLNINLLIAENEPVPGYFLSDFGSSTSWHLADGEGEHYDTARARHEAAREKLGVSGTLVPVRLSVLSSFDEEALEKYVSDGEIDMEAVDAGREVLVYAPDIYESKHYITFWEPEHEEEIIRHTVNDAYCAGQVLDIRQLWRAERLDEIEYMNRDSEGRYDEAEAVSAVTTVGAVLSGGRIWEDLEMVSDPCIITTEKGARAMGLVTATMQRLEVYLDGDVSEGTETYLADRLKDICMRADLSAFNNYLKWAREDRERQAQLTLVLVSVAVVFLAAAFSLIAGNIRRSIRSDERMIGTLRAVGADGRMLVSCYARQVIRCVVLGLLGAGIALGAALIMNVPMTAGAVVLAVTVMLAFSAVCLAACWLAMRRTIGEITKKSIVENIREL